MNILKNRRVHSRLKPALAAASLLLLSMTANADLIINNGASLTVGDASVLDVNCGDIQINSGGSFTLGTSLVRNLGSLNQPSGSVFSNNGGTLEPCRPLFSKSFSPSQINAGGVSTLTYTIENLTSSAATNLAFSDSLDLVAPLGGITLAIPANASTTCGLANLVANDGASSISLSGAQLVASSSCTVTVDVTSNVVSRHASVSGDLTSSLGNSGPATAELVVDEPAVVVGAPSFSKSFSPNQISLNSVSTLTYIISNGNPNNAVRGLTFVEQLPTGVTIAAPVSNASTTCMPALNGSTLSGSVGGNTVTFSGFTIAAASQCSVTVNVTASLAQAFTSTSGDLTSDQGNSGTASATIEGLAGFVQFSKTFAPSVVSVGERSRLTFIVDNTLGSSDISPQSFNDTFPSGLVVAAPPNISSDCSPLAEIVATAGGNSVSFSSPSFLSATELSPGNACRIAVDVVPLAQGDYVNVSDSLTFVRDGFQTLSAGGATDTLTATLGDIGFRQQFLADPVSPGDIVAVEFSLFNSDRTLAATAVAFNVDFGAALNGLVFTQLQENSCGGSVSGDNSGVLVFSNGSIAPEASCTIRAELSVPESALSGTIPVATSALTATLNSAPVLVPSISELLFITSAPRVAIDFNPDRAPAGGSATLDITVTNISSASAATEIGFITTFPLELATASVVPSDGECGPSSLLTFGSQFNSTGGSDSALTLSGGSLAAAGQAGDSCTFSITVDVSNEAGAILARAFTSPVTAIVSGVTEEAGQGVSDSLTILSGPSLSKAFSSDQVSAGETIDLEFTISNDSESEVSNASDISFTDDLDSVLAGLSATGLPANDICGLGSELSQDVNSVLSFSGGSLLSGESCTFSVSLQVPAAANSGNFTNTTSTLTSTIDGLSVESPAANDSFLVSGVAVSLTYLPDAVLPGEQISLQFDVSNTSLIDATDIFLSHDFSVVAPASAALTVVNGSSSQVNVCGVGAVSQLGSNILLMGASVLAGESCSFTVEFLVNAATPDDTYRGGTSIINVTQGAATVQLTNAVASFDVNSSQLTMTKSFIDDPVQSGGQVTLEYQISNNRLTDSVVDISFTDDLDGALIGLSVLGGPQSNVCGAGSLLSGTGLLSLSGGTLAAGAACVFSVTLQLPNAVNNSLINSTSSVVTGAVAASPITGAPASDDLLIQPVAISKSFANGAAPAGGDVVLSYFIENTSGSETISNARLADNLDGVITGLVATGLPTTDICGIGSSLSGSGVLSLQGVTLAANESCRFEVTLSIPNSASRGTFTSTSSALVDLTGGLIASPVSADLVIVTAPPLFTKTFIPNDLDDSNGGVIRYSIDNSNSVTELTSISFSDDIGGALSGLVATGLPLSDVCGVGSQLSGTTVVTLNVGLIAANDSCSFDVGFTVPSNTAPATVTSTTGMLVASPEVAILGVSDDLTVSPTLLNFSASFTPSSVDAGVVSRLAFVIENVTAGFDATDIAFDNNFPTGLVISSTPNVITTCPAGTVTAVGGSSILSYADGSLSAGQSCSVSIETVSSIGGAIDSVSGDLTSSFGNSGSATASLQSGDDRDNDGVTNDVDNCPNTANANQADLDQDGAGNACDSDDDGDGLPDDYEIANGLNPLNSLDQQADPDGDGFTNLDEFSFGSDPNVADTDNDNNGVPDAVDQRRERARQAIPAVLLLLLDDD